jgi:Erv1 / Alr family
METSSIDSKINYCTLAFSKEVYGPTSWAYLHYWSLRFPVMPTEYEKHKARDYLNLFISEEGCLLCKSEIVRYSQQTPVNFSSRTDLVWWFWQAHNNVNARKGKEIWTKEQFIENYISRVEKYFIAQHEQIKQQITTSTPATISKPFMMVRREGVEVEETERNIDYKTMTYIFGVITLFLLFICIIKHYQVKKPPLPAE